MIVPSMSKRHFEYLAALLANYTRLGEPLRPADVCRDFADALRSTNSQFNPSRFLKACGVADA